MNPLRVLYWGLSYTTGIACLTGLALRYAQKREPSTLRLIIFLLPSGLSIVSLSMLEAFASNALIVDIAGCLALVGAALVTASFPAFAVLLDPTKRRRRFQRIALVAGLALALANCLGYAITGFPFRGLIMLLTLVCLGVAIFLGMSWINRARPRWETPSHPAWMVGLFVVFGLAFVLDLLRSFLPALEFLGRDYLFFPGFYAFLNVFLFYSHVKIWAREGRFPESESDIIKPEAALRFGISERESEVAALLARGRTYSEIADELCVSHSTIKTHVAHLYEKSGARNRVELLNLLSPRIPRSADSSIQTRKSPD
jgi:DNA-binding CsgD family transcriptional regulator